MFIVLTSAQAVKARKALAKLEGYPVRGVTYCGPDRVDPVTPGPGWTIDAVDIDCDDGTTAGIDLPDSLKKYCGKTVVVSGQSVTLPALASLVPDEASLPKSLRDIRIAKRSAP